MGILSRLKQGWRLGIQSIKIVFLKPELLAFPLMSIVAIGLLGIVGLLLTPIASTAQNLAASGSTMGFVLLGTGIFLTAFGITSVSTFFAAGLVYCASQVFRGEDPEVSDGIRAAWNVKSNIIAWSLIAATVTVIVKSIERHSSGGQIIAAVFGVAWGILTYFVVPVMVLEDVGIRDMFIESGRAFRDRWGEYAGASVGVGVVFLLAIIGAIGVLIFTAILFSFSTSVMALLGIAFVLFVLLLVPIGQATTGVLKTALYLYATNGEVPEEYAGEDFEHLFVEKQARNGRKSVGRI